MIDQGVDGIFGHHPHIINGFEVYKNKPIFYSLGNFFFLKSLMEIINLALEKMH